MAGALELPLQPPRREGSCHHFLALLGASVVVFSVVGKPSVHPGYALTGFVLWLLGVATCCSIGHPALRSLFRGALSAAAADLAAEKLDHFLLRPPRSGASSGSGSGTGTDVTLKCSAQKPHQMSLAV